MTKRIERRGDYASSITTNPKEALILYGISDSFLSSQVQKILGKRIRESGERGF